MRRLLAATAALCVLACNANAGVYSDDMSKCLVKSTSADDQVVFSQWLFSALALHPSVKGMSNITDEQRNTLNAKAGALFVRLMTKDCRTETLAALKYEGGSAIEQSFMVFGQAAARTLMTDPAVEKGTEGLTTSVDTAEMSELLKEAGLNPKASK